MYFFCQHLVFVNFNNFKSCLVLSEVYSELFILCSHSSWFVGIFPLLCKILLLKFLPRKKIQQRTQKVISWRLYPTSHWRPSACRLSLLEKVAGGWKEEEKEITWARQPWPPSCSPSSALVQRPCAGGWAGEAELDVPVLSEQMSCCRLLDRAELSPWLSWQHGKVNSVLLLVAPVDLVVCMSKYSFVEIGATFRD